MHYENNDEKIEFNPRLHSKISPFELKTPQKLIPLNVVSRHRLVLRKDQIKSCGLLFHTDEKEY